MVKAGVRWNQYPGMLVLKYLFDRTPCLAMKKYEKVMYDDNKGILEADVCNEYLFCDQLM